MPCSPGYSLPTDLQDEEIPYRMQNLEIENAMLKNELHVVNREVSELLERLRKTEEGNFSIALWRLNIMLV